MRQDHRGTSWTRFSLGTSWTRAARLSGALTAAAALLIPTAGAAAAAPAPVVRAGTPAPYVVQAQPGQLAEAEQAVRVAGGTVTRRLTALQTLSVQLTPAAASLARRSPAITSLVGDRRVRLTGATYAPARDANSLLNVRTQVGATAAWSGTTGAGVDVALIDSGVSPVAGIDARRLINGPDLSFESNNSDLRHRDTFGHGTHMAGIILGRDASASVDGSDSSSFIGVAPSARLVSLKVADARGASDVTQVLAAIDWVITHRNNHGLNIRVLNLSFGTDSSQGYQQDPLAHAVEVAWAHGITVVTSAGNTGSQMGRLTLPAIDPFVIAVGASDSNGTIDTADDKVASFSSIGDGTRNPDLVAPGRSIQSLRVPGSYIDSAYGDAGGRIDERFFRGSGTSQAAAVVSGASALLLSQRPDLTPDQVKQVLRGSARPLAGASSSAQGAGLLDIPGALATKATGSRQLFSRGSGRGSIDASRGSMRLSYEGKVLDGERDIHDKAYDSARQARLRSERQAWVAGVWNGTTWTADGFAGSSWAASSWSASSWSGSSWAGSSWAGSSWASGTWTGSSWANENWSGSSWAGSSWAGSSWAGSSWAGSSWAGSSWAGSSWAGSTWASASWG